ncbi:MAG: hypothetical protein CSB33_04160 [Desulfobacterales bacterium]|nr:MAG: hypothetical protein CSB33_04160 [Desulfobacterales bacterium]
MNQVNALPAYDRNASAQPASEAAQKDVNAILARMVQLSSDALKAESVEKAARLIANRLHTVVKTDRVVIAPVSGKMAVSKRVYAVSGDVAPCQDNPFSEAVATLRKGFKGETEIQIVSHDDVPGHLNNSCLIDVLSAMGGASVLWVPVPAPDNSPPRFAIWMERWGKKPWTEEDIRLVRHLLVYFGYALGGAAKPEHLAPGGKWKRRLKSYWLWTLMLCLSFMPVQARVSAPFQVAADRPHYVFAPFDGVIEELMVRPGEQVRRGDMLYKYDTRVLEKQLEEAQRGGVASARAELARLEGAAYQDPEARARLPVQKLEVQRREAEAAFLQRQLDLSVVRTEADGVVVLDDPDALIGAFVQTGQMVLRVADPERTKLRVMVPVQDVGLIRSDSEMDIRLDSDPLKTHHAKVERIGFDVSLSDERVPSVMVEGRWVDHSDRIVPGQRGTATIQGPRVLFAVQFLRKQLIKIRNFFGI